MKIFIFLLFSFVKYIYFLNTYDDYESIVKDFNVGGRSPVWNTKEGDINYFRLYIFEQYENKEIEIQLEYPFDGKQLDTDKPCSNYSLIYINSNFTYSAQKSDIVNNENYVNTSLTCYEQYNNYPYSVFPTYYISTRYKLGKINSPKLYKYNIIGIKIQTFFDTGLFYVGISEVKKEEKKEPSFFSKYGLKISIIVIIINLILIGIGKALQKKKNNPIDNNDNSQNNRLLPQ